MARKPRSTSKSAKSVAPLRQPDDCPVKEDLRFQQATWIVERAGWVVMAMVVVAALAGLFGGPTTRRDAHDESGRVHVSYQHFQRQLDPTDMVVTVDAQGQSLLELTIDRALADSFEIRTIAPAPIETQAHEGGLLMKFAVSPGAEPARIALKGVPNRPGRLKGRIGLFGESPADLDIFIYP